MWRSINVKKYTNLKKVYKPKWNLNLNASKNQNTYLNLLLYANVEKYSRVANKRRGGIIGGLDGVEKIVQAVS